jgi:hypothetical protein
MQLMHSSSRGRLLAKRFIPTYAKTLYIVFQANADSAVIVRMQCVDPSRDQINDDDNMHTYPYEHM